MKKTSPSGNTRRSLLPAKGLLDPCGVQLVVVGQVLDVIAFRKALGDRFRWDAGTREDQAAEGSVRVDLDRSHLGRFVEPRIEANDPTIGPALHAFERIDQDAAHHGLAVRGVDERGEALDQQVDAIGVERLLDEGRRALSFSPVYRSAALTFGIGKSCVRRSARKTYSSTRFQKERDTGVFFAGTISGWKKRGLPSCLLRCPIDHARTVDTGSDRWCAASSGVYRGRSRRSVFESWDIVGALRG
jgi:hypothetical protein